MNKGVVSVLVAYLFGGYIRFIFMRCSMSLLPKL